MRISSRTAALVPLLAACLAGCATEEVARNPQAFEPRPVVVTLDRLTSDPCSMLDAAQQRVLGVGDGTPRSTIVNDRPSAICTLTTDSGYGYNLQTIQVGAETALTENGATPIDVNGFGAVRSIAREMTGGGPTCQVTVDAAPGQAIRVQAGASPVPPLPSDEEMCRLATEAASMVMTTAVRTTAR